MAENKCDICFITLPGNWASGQVPYYYLSLAGYLEANGFRSEIIDLAPRRKDFYGGAAVKNIFLGESFNAELFFEEISDRLSAIGPSFVGLSFFTMDYFFGMELARKIKEKIGCQIVAGNVHPSLFPEDCIYEGSPVDYAVIGEGEETLKELLEAKRLGRSLKEIAGLYYLDNNQPIRTRTRELVDLDALPRLPFDKIDMDYYLRPRQILVRNLILSGVDIFTGRGCPFFCDFCAANSIYKAQGVVKRARFQCLDSVFANIEELTKKYKADGIYIIDDTFTISEERVLEFCARIKPLKLIWGAETRVNLITPKMLKAMKGSGCVQLDFGVETGSAEMLARISKGISVEQIVKAFEMCKATGLRTFANILINLPGEEERHIKETEDLLKKIRPTVINVSILKPYPATPVFDQYVKMPHLEYMESLKKFLAGDLSLFRLCRHNLDLLELKGKLTGYTDKSLKGVWRDLRIFFYLLVRSARRRAYLDRALRIFITRTLVSVKKLNQRFFKFYGQKRSDN